MNKYLNKQLSWNRIVLFIALAVIFVHSFFIFKQKCGFDLDEAASFNLPIEQLSQFLNV